MVVYALLLVVVWYTMVFDVVSCDVSCVVYYAVMWCGCVLWGLLCCLVWCDVKCAVMVIWCAVWCGVVMCYGVCCAV